MAASNVQNVDDNLDFIFEHFIETLCSTHQTVCIDTDVQRKMQFKCYLLMAVVPFTTLARGLRYTQEDPDFTFGTPEQICCKILTNMKDKISKKMTLCWSDY